MAAFSNYLENQIASWLNGTAMATAPTTLYVALFSADPTDALTGSGSELTTAITGTANRVAVANNAWTKITATGVLDAAIKNTNDIVITGNSVSNTTLNASHFGVFDAITGSTNLLFHGQLASTIPIALGDAVKFAATTITLTIQ
jgi:hypothetical protein